MKVRDLMPMEIDIDVYDDVCEELGICFCGPMELTEEGEKHFSEVLEYDIKLDLSGSFPTAVCLINDDNDRVWKKRLRKAIKFFYSAAGYCDADDYDRWFKEV